MTLKADLESYRNGQAEPAADALRADRRPAPGRVAANWKPGRVAANWKILRAVGLALLVWALIGAVLLSI